MNKGSEKLLTIVLPLIVSIGMMASPFFLLPPECPLFELRRSGQFCHTIPPSAGCLCIKEPDQGTAQVLFFLGLGLLFVPAVIGFRTLLAKDSQNESISLVK